MTFRRTIQIAGVITVAVLAGLVAGSARAGDVNHARIAYSSMWDGQADIYSMFDTGTSKVNLTHDKTIGEREDVEPVWSPDGSLIAFEREYLKGGGEALMVMNSDGSKLHSLFPAAAIEYCHPAFTPNGKTIVFSSNRDGNFDLYSVNVDGKYLFRITKTDAPVQNLEPQVSPDGRFVVFTRPELSLLGGSSIYTTKIGSGIVHQLTQNYRWVGDHDPVFSPDGSMIAFTSDQAGSNDIYAMTANGTDVKTVTTKLSNDNHPTWSPNGKSIAFVSDRTGATEIYAFSTADGSLKQLTSDKAFKANPMWQSAMPTVITPPRPTPVAPLPTLISPPNPTILPPPAPIPNHIGPK
jgi:Tol biopolymer transport system component